jgi:hypothetical protein
VQGRSRRLEIQESEIEGCGAIHEWGP